MPVSGWRNGNSGALNNVGVNGNFWSSTENDSENARNLWFNSGNVNVDNWNWRSNANSVRCVAELTRRNQYAPTKLFLLGLFCASKIKKSAKSQTSPQSHIPTKSIPTPNLCDSDAINRCSRFFISENRFVITNVLCIYTKRRVLL